MLAGPWAGQLLADLGAEVIKVESLAGDDTRQWGPPFVENSDGDARRRLFPLLQSRQALDRGRFRHQRRPRDRRRLAGRADVLIENFRVGGLAGIGSTITACRPPIPRLVYCSITGFGQTGPYAALARLRFPHPGDGRDHGPDRRRPRASRRRSASPSPTSSPASMPSSRSRRRCAAREQTGRGQ